MIKRKNSEQGPNPLTANSKSNSTKEVTEPNSSTNVHLNKYSETEGNTETRDTHLDQIETEYKEKNIQKVILINNLEEVKVIRHITRPSRQNKVNYINFQEEENTPKSITVREFSELEANMSAIEIDKNDLSLHKTDRTTIENKTDSNLITAIDEYHQEEDNFCRRSIIIIVLLLIFASISSIIVIKS